MPIRVKCPKCQTILGVKESLAGKKANCPKCRFLLSIPAPKPPAAKPATPPSEDIEALALSTLAEEAPKPATVETIEFECPFCAEMVKVSADLAGKQTPCPNQECKRIIKVPLPKADKPKDWREVDPRAAMAGLMKDGKTQPDNAWSTAQKMRVSTEALEEADAIPIKKAPVTTGTWVRRGVLAGVALLAIGGGAWFFFGRVSSAHLEAPLNEAMEQVQSNPKLTPVAAASILRGAGQFYGRRSKALQAKEQLDLARAKLTVPADNARPDAERDTVLIDLALALIDLGGTPESEENPTRLDWGTVQKELGRVVQMLSTVEAKQTGLREIAAVLISQDRGEIAVAVASQFSQPAPKFEVQPGDPDNKPAPASRSPLDAEQIAILVAIGQKAEANQIRPMPGAKSEDKVAEKDKIDDENKDKEKQPVKVHTEEVDGVAHLGYAEGEAWSGNFAEARRLAKHTGLPMERFEASLAVALIAGAKKKTAEAKANVEDALEASSSLDKTKMPAWLLIQFTRACARAGMADEAKKIADLPADKEVKALAHLELVLPQIESSTAPLPASVLDSLNACKDTLAYGLALEKLARHNVRYGQRAAEMPLPEGLDDAQKAFIQIGVAVGQLEAMK
jgi:ssDNA-binding Zn-finger/Zn-ribbon topoisomerase 1